MDNLPIDIFLKFIDYLPFEDILTLSRVSRKYYYNYVGYDDRWLSILIKTYSSTSYFKDKLRQAREDTKKEFSYLKTNHNYLVFFRLFYYCDTLFQCVTHYRRDKQFIDTNDFSKNVKYNLRTRRIALWVHGINDESMIEFNFQMISDMSDPQNHQKLCSEMVRYDSVEGMKLYKKNNVEHVNSLILAVQMDKTNVVKYLVQEKPEVLGWVLETFSDYGNYEMVKYLTETYLIPFDPKMEFEINMATVAAKTLQIVKYFFDTFPIDVTFSAEAVRKAAVFKRLDIVKYYVEEQNFKVFDLNPYIIEQLINISNTGHIIQYLVEKGIYISRKTKTKILQRIIQDGDLDTVKFFTDKGFMKLSSFEIACKWGHFDIIKYLETTGFDIKRVRNVCFLLAVKSRHYDIAKYLLEEKGANIHYKDDEAFRNVCKDVNLEIVKYLHEKGANIHAMDDCALRNAISVDRSLPIVKYLVEQGCKIQLNFRSRNIVMEKHGEIKKYIDQQLATRAQHW